jgi:hypothetical protein
LAHSEFREQQIDKYRRKLLPRFVLTEKGMAIPQNPPVLKFNEPRLYLRSVTSQIDGSRNSNIVSHQLIHLA